MQWSGACFFLGDVFSDIAAGRVASVLAALLVDQGWTMFLAMIIVMVLAGIAGTGPCGRGPHLFAPGAEVLG